MSYECAGKHVLITGAAGGLGASLSERFGRAGAVLGLIDLDAEALEKLLRELTDSGIRAACECVDITDAKAVERAVARLEESSGPVHTLVNNAGITHIANFGADQAAAAKRVIDVNLIGSINCTAATIECIKANSGSIVAISSVAGFAPLLGRTAYAASKHAIHGFFETLRLELRHTGVGVLVVCPSFIATGIRAHLDSEENKDASRGRTVGEDMHPDYVANRIFESLLSDDSELMVGSVAVWSRRIRRLLPRLYERLMLKRVQDE